ncbi:MAG: methyltransferase domain-containing protein [Gemmatimonadales bacterium]|nr:methyltransferase domain-containing protein [Gemmatimonadales bacterium]
MGNVTDQWAAGSTYEGFMGRWSRRVAPKFVSWLQVPAGVHWLDVGCGTGALTDVICKMADPASVVGCDPSEPFVQYAREHHSHERSSFVIAGAGALPTRPGGFESVTSLLALNFFAQPESAIEEMSHIAGSGATVSACVWDYAGRMGFLRYFWDVAVSVDPSVRELDEGNRFPICRRAALDELFRNAQLRDVCCEPIEITTEFASFSEYWEPFLGGSGPAPSYVASLEDERRTALASELERAVPSRPDGTIALIARAWAVRGSNRHAV